MKNLKYNDNELSVYSGIMVLTFIFLLPDIEEYVQTFKII